LTRPETAFGIEKNLTRYGDIGFSRYLRRAFLSSAGYDRADLDRPIIGIVNTSSDYNTCHRQMPEMIDAVKRGVLEAGGLPLAFPTISLNEILTSPTTMLYRNLAAMETEEMIRAQPMDGVVLMGGCDKTVPAQGVRDMVRISDARMSGTAYGSIVLHCSPEACVGGPIALVKDGDWIELDVENNRMDLLVDPDELALRRQRLQLPQPPSRGWAKLYAEHVQQAHLGCDLDFL